jgi:iron complex outermembrane receptor protein
MLTRTLFFSAAAFGALAGAAQAEDGSGAPAATARQLDEIVVTAQRRESRLRDVPFSVAVVTAQALERSGVTSLTSLPTLVPGLTWGGQGGYAQPALRGVSTTVASAGSGSPIAIYLDGVYQPQQVSTVMDLPDVSSIEVLKGPQGTLFGRNATGGAILINTVQPTFGGPQARFTTEVGAYNGGQSKTAVHTSVKGYVSAPIVPDVLAGSLSAYFDYTPGYIKDLRTGGRRGAINSAGVRAKLLWNAGANTEVLLGGYYLRRTDQVTETGVPLRGVTVASLYPGSIYGTKPWTGAYLAPPKYAVSNLGLSLRVTHTIDGVGKLTSTTGYNDYRPYARNGPDFAYSPACAAAFACIDFWVRDPEKALSEELLFTSEKLGRLQFVSGLYGFYDAASEHSVVNDGALYLSDLTVFTRSVAAFVEANYDVTDALTLVAGVRYNHESKVAKGGYFNAPFVKFVDARWNSLTPRISLKYKVSDRLNAYATFSEGFKGGVVPAHLSTDPPARPEKLYSYEVGVKYARPSLAFNLAGFYYDYKDMQQEFNNGRGDVIPRNASSAKIYGVDFDVTANISDDFTLKAGFEWMPRARFERYTSAIVYTFPLGPFGLTAVTPYDASDTRLLTAPKFTGTLTGSYRKDLPAGTVDGTLSLYYSSAFRFEPLGRVRQAGYATVNAQVGLTPAGHSNLRLGAFARNLTNKAVITGIQATATSDGAFYAAPREIGVSLQLSY